MNSGIMTSFHEEDCDRWIRASFRISPGLSLVRWILWIRFVGLIWRSSFERAPLLVLGGNRCKIAYKYKGEWRFYCLLIWITKVFIPPTALKIKNSRVAAGFVVWKLKIFFIFVSRNHLTGKEAFPLWINVLFWTLFLLRWCVGGSQW
jgi:hypothetical protein